MNEALFSQELSMLYIPQIVAGFVVCLFPRLDTLGDAPSRFSRDRCILRCGGSPVPRGDHISGLQMNARG